MYLESRVSLIFCVLFLFYINGPGCNNNDNNNNNNNNNNNGNNNDNKISFILFL